MHGEAALRISAGWEHFLDQYRHEALGELFSFRVWWDVDASVLNVPLDSTFIDRFATPPNINIATKGHETLQVVAIEMSFFSLFS